MKNAILNKKAFFPLVVSGLLLAQGSAMAGFLFENAQNTPIDPVDDARYVAEVRRQNYLHFAYLMSLLDDYNRGVSTGFFEFRDSQINEYRSGLWSGGRSIVESTFSSSDQLRVDAKDTIGLTAPQLKRLRFPEDYLGNYSGICNWDIGLKWEDYGPSSAQIRIKDFSVESVSSITKKGEKDLRLSAVASNFDSIVNRYASYVSGASGNEKGAEYLEYYDQTNSGWKTPFKNAVDGLRIPVNYASSDKYFVDQKGKEVSIDEIRDAAQLGKPMLGLGIRERNKISGNVKTQGDFIGNYEFVESDPAARTEGVSLSPLEWKSQTPRSGEDRQLIFVQVTSRSIGKFDCVLQKMRAVQGGDQ